MKIISICLFSIFACVLNSCAQDQQSYNVKRALECLQSNDIETAKEYLHKELDFDSKSVHALDILAYIGLNEKEYGTALSRLNKAMRLCPKREKKLKSAIYTHRAKVYLALKDTVKASADYLEAYTIDNTDKETAIAYADLLFAQTDYATASEIYKSMMKHDAGNPYPYYGIARNLYNEDKLAEAKEMIDKACRIDSDKERAAIMQMRIEIMMKNHAAAMDYAIAALRVNEDSNEPYYGIMEISDSAYQITINHLTKAAFEDDINPTWQYILGHVYIRHHKYDEAIKQLLPIAEGNSRYKMLGIYWCADAYEEKDEHANVIRLMDIALAEDSTDADNYIKRATSKFYIQDLAGSEKDYLKAMEFNKSYGYYTYYRLGWIKEMQGRFEEALADYNMGIALNEDYAYTYMMKGNLLMDRLNKPEEAREALHLCIEKDKGISEGTCKQYAYLALGDTLRAIEVVDSIISVVKEPGAYYDAACIYSRMGRKDKAISYLKTAFEMGYRSTRHMEADDDMDNIREMEEFKQLIEKYGKESQTIDPKLQSNVVENQGRETAIELPIKAIGGGVYSLKCEINELPMSFILDTGCSDVSMSSVESEFMKKNGYLSSSDYRGYITYQTANGEIHKAREINIRKLTIGGISITNVRGSIATNQKAPLLLGQNILRQFGRYEIDNTNGVLRIYNQNK